MVERRDFGKLKPIIQPPDLIAIQTQSYQDFLQIGVPPDKRAEMGLQAIFHEIFPIDSWEGRYTLQFDHYEIGPPKEDALTALANGGTYSAPLRASFRLQDGEEFREEEVFMGEIPIMTRDGAFIINGAERVIVSQLHRSPGICTETQQHQNGQPLYSVRLIPDRGSWIEVQFDADDIMWVYMDRRRRRRKFYATTLLRAFGHGTDEDILKEFYEPRTLFTKEEYAEETLKPLVAKTNVIDVVAGVPLVRCYEPITPALIARLRKSNVATIDVWDTSMDDGTLLKTVKEEGKSGIHSEDDALKDIYRRLRPGDPPTSSNAKNLMKRTFHDPRRYDLGKVGRHKINQRLHQDGAVPEEMRTLEEHGIDVIRAIKLLLDIFMGRKTVDDIDHLGSRRIRTAGELLENQCRVGLSRTERLIRERMTLFDSSSGVPLQPSRLVNSKSLSAVVGDFFGRSQLSQFMDQTNPLSGLAHKRRLSALGPGGLSRERAGFEVRDVHPSHYGRICPIETPEGPNIGLISSLGIYAKINEYGFIETPYRKVVDGRATDEVVYMSADEEENYVIAQANSELDANGRFTSQRVTCRYKADFVERKPELVQFMDVSPMQVISIAAGLIPFLEHDDANRALMGANMMRQGVPLLRTERPFVATGLEWRAASDSCVTVLAEEDGIIAYVSATEIVQSPDGTPPPPVSKEELDAREDDAKKEQAKAMMAEREAKDRANGIIHYHLQKFRRCNAGTCFNQKPIVKVGQAVKKGDALADGPATDQGELALGKNLMVAFMPWRGYNFEDAILLSEKCVRDDVFTSVHIQDFEVGARDTKLGPEEITRDIPNVGEDLLRNLGPDGVVIVGAEIKPGDILVGKITPKSETELAPEERLLRAIFGEKAAEVRDTSLTVPSGVYGIVMDVKVTQQLEDKKTLLSSTSEKIEEKKEARVIEAERKKKREALEQELTTALSDRLLGEKIPLDVINARTGEVIIPQQKKITKKVLGELSRNYDVIQIETSPIADLIEKIISGFRQRFIDLEESISGDGAYDDLDGINDGSVIKQVRVYIAEKKNISVGDKLAGRHGNKGVVSKIVPDCDMPFLPDGTPVDIVLNPLGVPSRMNLGQLFETYLGLACKVLGFHAATPVFDGVQESEIDELLRKSRQVQEEQKKPGDVPWICEDGKTILYDGRTGEPFDQRVVVGQIYMLKLHHLVTDKIHARATGPYSLVTQQPLGGKAQYGGQRMGEMEVWALEAYGVAYALQELLTVKSDDVMGRTRIYESIVKGENTLEAGMPESFSVLMHELRGLCLDMKLLGGDSDSASTPDYRQI
ncbi:MAG: DNA-directed RNA polymerase subunit beta [Kiritimatiellae bacterium]|nr:DNA-directed RNA polymerase subunit beta [Kiritimatiellia bacterium]